MKSMRMVARKIRQQCQIAIVLVIAALIAIWFWHTGGSLTQEITLILAMTTLLCLAKGWGPDYGILFAFLVCMVIIGGVPIAVALSGLKSSGFWLIVAGILIGMACTETGLVQRFATKVLAIRCQKRYAILVGLVVLLGSVLAMFLPSTTSRVMLMMPLLMAFATAHGFQPQSQGYNGLVLGGTLSTMIVGFSVLPANLSNVILMGASKDLYNITLPYGHFLMLHWPVLAIVKVLALWGVLCFFCHDTPTTAHSAKATSVLKSWSHAEIKLTIGLAVVVVLWLLDSITHLPPVWPAVVLAMLCVIPKWGVLDLRTVAHTMNHRFLAYVVGILGFASVLQASGVATQLETSLLGLLPLKPGQDALNFALLSLGGAGIGMMTTLPGVPAVMTPLAGQLAKVTHLPLYSILMTQVVGYSTFVLPYQAPPIMVAVRLGHVPLKVAARICLWMALCAVWVVIPLDQLWWSWLGMFGHH